MAQTFTGNLGVTASFTDQRTAVAAAANETGTRAAALAQAWNIATAGTTSGLADRGWSDTRSIADAGTMALTLTTLTDSFGSTVNFVRVKAIVVICSPANTSLVSVTRPASGLAFMTAVGAMMALPAGGWFGIADPATGTPTSGATLLHLVNSAGGGAAIVTIAIVGTSA